MTGNSLDQYADRYAERTRGMTASEIRALFAVASRPEVVSLAGGMPNIAGLPLDVVGDALKDLVLESGPVAMQYGSGQGDPKLRGQICDVMRLEGIDAHPDDVVVTVGSQQAVDLVTRVFCDPGDVVICEAPSTSARWASSAPTSARSSMSRWTTTGCSRRRWSRPSPPPARPASG
jgi:2-aminoadipate transaminase